MKAAIAALRQRFAMMVARGVVRLVYDAVHMQELQVRVMHDEVIDRVEHPQPYGFTAHPHAGAEAFVMFAGGSRDHGIVVMVDDRRFRITELEPGEVAVYTDEDQLPGGHRIHFRRGQKIEIRAGTEVRINVGDGASQLIMTPEGTRLITPDFAADQG